MQDVHSHVHGGVSLRRSTPYTLCRFAAFPSRGNKGLRRETENSYASCNISAVPPLVAGATTFPPLCCGTMGAGQGCQFACGAATERNRTTGPVARWKCTPFGANAPPFPRWGTLLYASLCANLSCSLHSAAREALIKSLSDFILAFLFNARNKSTRIASYLRRLMTQHWIKIHMKFDSAN